MRSFFAVIVLCIAAWSLWNLAFTTDRERVEKTVERLVEIARAGGEEAADTIFDALADDYRGSTGKAQIRRYLDRYVKTSRLGKLTIGSFDTIATGEEIRVPLLAVRSGLSEFPHPVLLTITWAERGGEWKIVDLSRWRRE